MPRGGHNKKSLEQHILDGTYREDRHGPLATPGELSRRPEATPRARCGRPEKWARSKADELAIANGCWFDEKRAAYVVQWFREHLKLSDSRWSGQPFDLLQWQIDEIIYPLFGWMRTNERGEAVRRFNRTYIEIPKKNGKSTLASGVGLYMLAGEGHRGNEVYSAATDKDQASIVHGEAIRMVEASPKLSAIFNINYSTKHIYSRELANLYKAISARPAGAEGFKGNCCIIDELHAWYGDELWNALRYLGVNWSERLIFVITTAGDDTESVCYQQYELAKAVQAGEIENEQLMVCIHEAEEGDDLNDEDVQRNANPSLGETILAGDLRADIADAKATPRLLAALKRYRFNIWTTSSSPWIDIGEWDKCRLEYTDDDLQGLLCVGALDLARKRDWCAFMGLFWDKQREMLLQRPWFWLPEATADSISRNCSVRVWADAGLVKLTDGDVADYQVVEDDICDIIKQFKMKAFAFDEKYAEEITQRICNRVNVERVAFAQTIANYTGPATAYEKEIASGKMRHNGNPLLRWQAGNAKTKEDNNGNIRPVKQKRGDWRVMDGIQCGVMARGLIDEHIRKKPSVYRRRGVLVA